MKYILALGLFLGFHGSIKADMHSWEELPKVNQLYMVVHLDTSAPVQERQTLIIERWNGDSPIYYSGINGWWDVNPCSLCKWFGEGSKVIYLPSGQSSISYLECVLLTLDSDLDQHPCEF